MNYTQAKSLVLTKAAQRGAIKRTLTPAEVRKYKLAKDQLTYLELMVRRTAKGREGHRERGKVLRDWKQLMAATWNVLPPRTKKSPQARKLFTAVMRPPAPRYQDSVQQADEFQLYAGKVLKLVTGTWHKFTQEMNSYNIPTF